MENLAPETLDEIANYLRGDRRALLQLGLVSRRWYNTIARLLYRAPQFNRRNSFDLFYNNLTEANGRLIRELDLDSLYASSHQEKNHILFNIISRTPNLAILNVNSHIRLSDAVLRLVARTLSNLTVLSVDYCFDISGLTVRHVLRKCKQLRELHLTNVLISNDTLMAMAIHAPQLTRLHLTSGPFITERDVRAILTEHKGLKHLEIRNCRMVVGDFGDIIHNSRVVEYVRTGGTITFTLSGA